MSKYEIFVEKNKLYNKMTNNVIKKYNQKISQMIILESNEEIKEVYITHGITILKPKNSIILTNLKWHILDFNSNSVSYFDLNNLLVKGCKKFMTVPGKVVDMNNIKLYSKVYLAYSSNVRKNVGPAYSKSQDKKVDKEILTHSNIDLEKQKLLDEGWIIYKIVSDNEIIFAIPQDRVIGAAFFLILGIILVPFTAGLVLIFGFPMFISNFITVVNRKKKCKVYHGSNGNLVKEVF